MRRSAAPGAALLLLLLLLAVSRAVAAEQYEYEIAELHDDEPPPPQQQQQQRRLLSAAGGSEAPATPQAAGYLGAAGAFVTRALASWFRPRCGLVGGRSQHLSPRRRSMRSVPVGISMGGGGAPVATINMDEQVAGMLAASGRASAQQLAAQQAAEAAASAPVEARLRAWRPAPCLRRLAFGSRMH